jgi:LysM repeat protein
VPRRLSLLCLFFFFTALLPQAAVHRVKDGDTLESVARLHGVTQDALLKANALGDGRSLPVGHDIVIPGKDTPPKPAQTHVVKPGETFSAIGRKYGLSAEALQKANPGISARNLNVGHTLKIPGPVPPGPTSIPALPPPQASTPQIHVVSAGETLSKIGRIYSVPVSEIKKANGLASDLLRVGQKLTIPGSVVAELSGPPEKTPTPTPPPRFLFVDRVKDEIDAPKRLRKWKYIVVHHSGTPSGNAKIFDYYHRNTSGMENGLAYHFVIGNGRDSGDGAIEVGGRWRKQLQGGHLHSDELNEVAIGICFVGDFNSDRPTKKQLAAAIELVTYLRKICGHPAFKAHREINPRPTDCPGRLFPTAAFHKLFDNP